MGEVWLARDTLLERDVALKFATFASTDEALLQFRVEARAVARQLTLAKVERCIAFAFTIRRCRGDSTRYQEPLNPSYRAFWARK